MTKEIYIRTPEDPDFIPDVIDYSNEIEQLLSQVRLVLGTKKGDVLGSYDFGVDLEYLVFSTKVSSETIRQKIMDQITSYCYISPNLSFDIQVSFGASGKGYDYALVDVIINGVKSLGFLIDKD